MPAAAVLWRACLDRRTQGGGPGWGCGRVPRWGQGELCGTAISNLTGCQVEDKESYSVAPWTEDP